MSMGHPHDRRSPFGPVELGRAHGQGRTDPDNGPVATSASAEKAAWTSVTHHQMVPIAPGRSERLGVAIEPDDLESAYAANKRSLWPPPPTVASMRSQRHRAKERNDFVAQNGKCSNEWTICSPRLVWKSEG